MTDQRISAFSCLMSDLGVGIVVAGLFAPRSGAATRQLIQRKAEKAEKLLKNTMHDGTQYVVRRGTEMFDEAAEVMERGKEAGRTASERLAHAAF